MGNNENRKQTTRRGRRLTLRRGTRRPNLTVVRSAGQQSDFASQDSNRAN